MRSGPVCLVMLLMVGATLVGGCVSSRPPAPVVTALAGPASSAVPSLPAESPSLVPPPVASGPSSPGVPPPARTTPPVVHGGPPTTTAPVAPARAPSATDLRGALLTPQDLSGYALDTDPNDNASKPSGCAALDVDLASGSTASAGVLLVNNQRVPFVREQLAQMPSGGAGPVLARIRGASSGCAAFSSTDEQYGKVRFTVSTLGTPTLGDATVGLTITMTIEDGTLSGVSFGEDLIVIRHADTVIALSETTIGPADSADAAGLARRAFAKVASRW